MKTYEQNECENRNIEAMRKRAENMPRFEITQGDVYIGSFKAVSAEKALEIAPDLFYSQIEALHIDGNPPLIAKEIK